MDDQADPKQPTQAHPKHILDWMNERFPFAGAIGFFTLFLTTLVVARGTLENTEIHLYLRDILGALAVWSFFLVVRIFDEHKDYEEDILNHPGRVLQSGQITLAHLKVMAGVSIAAQLTFSIWVDKGIGPAVYSWLIMFGWTCLMGKEFFCGEWLEKRLTLYAFSHMLVTPMAIWWMANLALPGTTATPELITMMILAFISGFTFEITRKTRGPEEERPTVDSYSKIFGTRGSALVVMGLASLMLAAQYWLVNLIHPANIGIAYSILLLGWILSMFTLFKFIKAPTLKGRENNEKLVALSMLIGYGVIIGSGIATHGLAFG